MAASRLLAGVVCALVGWSAISAPAQTAAAPAAAPIRIEAGVPLGAALESLRAHGAQIVYSTALVPSAMRVKRPVSGAVAIDVARALLAPHGLQLRPLGAGMYAVVAGMGSDSVLLAGQVIDAQAGRAVPGARIEATDDGYVAWSDARGAFTLRTRAREVVELQVMSEGYAPKVLQVAGEARGEALAIRLQPSPAALEQVTVVASRFRSDTGVAGSTFLLNQQDIVAQPKIGEDALQSMARLPGIAFSGVSGRPNVRGGEETEALVLFDGMPIREAFHLPTYNRPFSAIDENLAARIDAHTGTLPVRFGNRLAAIVAIESPVLFDMPQQAIGISTNNARAMIGRAATGERAVEWLAAARAGTMGAWLDEYSPDVGEPTYGDLFARIGASSDSGVAWRAQVFGTRSSLDYLDQDTTENANLSSHATYAWLSATQTLSAGWAWYALLGYSGVDSERRGTLAGGLTPEGELDDERTSDIWDLALRAVFELSPRQTLEAGVQLSAGRARYRYDGEVEFDPIATALFGVPESREREIALDVRRSFAGVFVNDRVRLADDWIFEAGVRIDRDLEGPDSLRTYVSPQFALRWDAGPLTTWRLSLARAHQSDEVHELRVEDGVSAFAPAQRADQAVLSVDHRPAPELRLRVEGFERRLDNPRVRYENLLDPLRLLPDLSPDRIAVDPDSARLRGLEFSAQWERGEWSLWGAYTHAEALDEIAGIEVPRDWDQSDTLAAAATWRRGPWLASALFTYHTGRPTTPVLDASLDSPLLGARNSVRLGDYATIDVRVAREWQFASGRLTAYAQLTNAFDRANPCCTEIDLPDEDSDADELEVERITAYPIFPAIGITWAF